ncbi:MAG: DUF2512 family protein [Veillonellaceae bacterium]|nr:DUF2512 family protein [Veillonellaceae bacterium]
MTGLLMKIIVCPIVLVALSLIIPSHVDYPNIIFPILIGTLIAVVGFGMEVMFLSHGTVWPSTILDFLATTLIVYFSQNAAAADITFLGAIIAGLLVGATEHFMHIHLVNSGKVDSDGQERP